MQGSRRVNFQAFETKPAAKLFVVSEVQVGAATALDTGGTNMRPKEQSQVRQLEFPSRLLLMCLGLPLRPYVCFHVTLASPALQA